MKAIILLIFFSPLQGAMVVLKPKEILPVEFIYLVESLQQYPLTNIEQEELSQEIKKLDKLLSQMTKEEVFFTLKSEIYKELLSKPKLAQQEKLYEKKILKPLLEHIEAKIDSYHSFAKWIIIAIYSDFKQIFDSPYYNTLVVEKKAFRLKNKNALLLEKKLTLVLPWYDDILHQSPEEFHEYLKPFMKRIMGNIYLASSILVQFSRLESTPVEDKLYYFEPVNPVKQEEKKDPIENLEVAQSPSQETPKNEWIPKNEPLEPNPKYIPPEKLPIPTDDW